MTTAFKTSKRGLPELVRSQARPAAFSSATGGFCAPEDIHVAVCLLPGTELSFAYEVKRSRLWPWTTNANHHKTAIFRQVNIDCPHAHHDALE